MHRMQGWTQDFPFGKNERIKSRWGEAEPPGSASGMTVKDDSEAQPFILSVNDKCQLLQVASDTQMGMALNLAAVAGPGICPRGPGDS